MFGGCRCVIMVHLMTRQRRLMAACKLLRLRVVMLDNKIKLDWPNVWLPCLAWLAASLQIIDGKKMLIERRTLRIVAWRRNGVMEAWQQAETSTPDGSGFSNDSKFQEISASLLKSSSGRRLEVSWSPPSSLPSSLTRLSSEVSSSLPLSDAYTIYGSTDHVREWQLSQ